MTTLHPPSTDQGFATHYGYYEEGHSTEALHERGELRLPEPANPSVTSLSITHLARKARR